MASTETPAADDQHSVYRGPSADPYPFSRALVHQSESQPLWRIHGLCLLGDKFEKRVFERYTTSFLTRKELH